MARYTRQSAHPSESEVQRRILEWLAQQRRVVVIKLIAANRAGYPDILCCVNGNFVSLEVKREGGSVSPLQLRRIAEIQEAGGCAEVVRSLEDARKIVEPLLEKGI